MGKGSSRRPSQVTQQAFADAWERCFNRWTRCVECKKPITGLSAESWSQVICNGCFPVDDDA